MGCRVLTSNNYMITCSYAIHQSRPRGKQHIFGVDIVTAQMKVCGIKAHTAGTVRRVIDYIKEHETDRQGYGFGNQVIIEHDGGYCTVYSHMAPGSISVKAGERVQRGQVIGQMGSTGNSTAAHLDFSVFKLIIGWTSELDLLRDIDVRFKIIDPEMYLDAELPVKNEILEHVQVGSFELPEYAIKRYDELKEKGFPAIIKFWNGHYRIQVGAYSEHRYALNMFAKLVAAGYDCYITTEAGTDVNVDNLRKLAGM